MILIYRSFEPPCTFQPLFPKYMRKSRDQGNFSAGALAAKVWSFPCFLSCFSATLVNHDTWRISGLKLRQTPPHRSSRPPDHCPWHYCSSVLPPDKARILFPWLVLRRRCAGGMWALHRLFPMWSHVPSPQGGGQVGGHCHGGDCLPIFLPAGQARVCAVKRSLTFLFLFFFNSCSHCSLACLI